MAKSTNTIPPGLLPGNRTTKPFELIYSDCSGKQPVPSYGNSLYYITFIDDYTRMGWIFFLKNKSDAAKTVQEFVKYAERLVSYQDPEPRPEGGCLEHDD